MPAKNVEILEAEWIARSGRGSCDVLSQHWYNSSSPSVTLINDFVSASSSALECWEQLHTINIFHNYLVQCVEDVFSSAFGKFHLKANYFEGKCCKYIIHNWEFLAPSTIRSTYYKVAPNMKSLINHLHYIKDAPLLLSHPTIITLPYFIFHIFTSPTTFIISSSTSVVQSILLLTSFTTNCN